MFFFLLFCVVGCRWTARSTGPAGHVRPKRRWGTTWLQGLQGTNRITGKIWTAVRVKIIEVKRWREHWVVQFNPLIRCVYVFFPKGMPGLPGEKGESGHVGLMVSSYPVKRFHIFHSFTQINKSMLFLLHLISRFRVHLGNLVLMVLRDLLEDR